MNEIDCFNEIRPAGYYSMPRICKSCQNFKKINFSALFRVKLNGKRKLSANWTTVIHSLGELNELDYTGH